MHESVNAILDFDESTKVRQVAHATLDSGTDRVLLVQMLPRILFKLLQAQGDAPLGWVHVQYDSLNFIPDLDDLRRMLHPLRPGHLAHMYEALNALLEFNEGTIVGDAQDSAAHVRADRVALGSVQPRIRRELLESQ